jgi:hypothetical protein
MTPEERAALVRALVDAAPPLTEVQLVRIAALLAPTISDASSPASIAA